MSSTAKGNAFESLVYECLERQILNDQFWARKECCRLFRKKAYYSKDRGSGIEFDISIEIYLPNESDYSILTLVECKDYAKPVRVDDLEEFWAKVQQVAGVNVKAIFASTAAFQNGALRFAESKGFAVVRYLANDTLKWVLKRSASWAGAISHVPLGELRDALTSDRPNGRFYDCVFFVKGAITHSSSRMFETLILQDDNGSHIDIATSVTNPTTQPKPIVPYVERVDIESAAARCLEAVNYNNGPVNLSAICEWQRTASGLSVTHELPLRDAPLTLGTLDFAPNRISVYSNDATSGRARFTLAHELGHVLMNHSQYFIRESTYESDLQANSYTAIDFVDLRRIEWQANFFASSLLLPAAQFSEQTLRIARQLELRDRGFGLIYLDNQADNVAAFFAVTGYLSDAFKVSRQATVIRLKTLGYLNDAREQNGFQNFRSFVIDAD